MKRAPLMKTTAYLTQESMAAMKALLFSSPAIHHRSFPSFRIKVNPSKTLFIRSRSFHPAAVTVCRSVEGGSGEDNESGLRNSDTGAAIDLKLPRRRLLVEFTCNQCGERTKRLINRLAYERGLVFVQCGGCERHHKLVDNLGLIVEYDFREEIDVDSNTDQV